MIRVYSCVCDMWFDYDDREKQIVCPRCARIRENKEGSPIMNNMLRSCPCGTQYYYNRLDRMPRCPNCNAVHPNVLCVANVETWKREYVFHKHPELKSKLDSEFKSVYEETNFDSTCASIFKAGWDAAAHVAHNSMTTAMYKEGLRE